MLSRKTVPVTIAVVILFALGSAGASAQYTVIQIADNLDMFSYPRINDNGYVVWGASDGSGFEIFLYDGTNTLQVTDADYEGMYYGLFPGINNEGQVVWRGPDGSDDEIFLYDGTSITQLTDNDYEEGYYGISPPQINDNGYVVWDGCDGGTGSDCTGGDWEIFLYDGTTTTQLTDNDYDDVFPRINDSGYVTWQGRVPGESPYFADSEIFLYDGTTTTQLTDNDYDDGGFTNLEALDSTQISNNGNVAWLGCEDDIDSWACAAESSFDIFFYDGTSVFKLRDPPYIENPPDMNDGGYAVWTEGDPLGERHTFLYTGTSTIQLPLYHSRFPRINNGGYVVGQGWDGSDNEIYLYDGADTIQLTDNDEDDQHPQINDNGIVVWMGPLTESGFSLLLAVPCSVDEDYDDDGYVSASCGGDDCDDGDLDVNPGVEESVSAGNCADGIDNDCDGSVDNCGAGCTASAAASTLEESPVYASEDLSKHLVCFLLAVGGVLGLLIRRGKR